ncbi:hypothetical protein AMTRI_Chr04g243030 [Amborella trichopoda]
MMVTLVPGQQTLNCTICLSTSRTSTSKHGPASTFVKSELAELNGSALAYQNMLIIFLTFSINTPADGNFNFFYDIMTCRDQVQRVRGSLIAHLWVHVVE